MNKKPALIVGIAAHVHEQLENSTWPESVYVSLAQNSPLFATLAVRTQGDPLQFTKAVREQVRRIGSAISPSRWSGPWTIWWKSKWASGVCW